MLLPVLANITRTENTPSLSSLISIPSPCHDVNHCRTFTDIIWLCLTSMLVSIGICAHPNIPMPKPRGRQDKDPRWRNRWKKMLIDGWSPVRDQLVISISALLAPEFILLTAIQQRFVARIIAEECEQARTLQAERTAGTTTDEFRILAQREEGWTIIHGFFVLMGGFYFFKDDTPLHPLTQEDLIPRIEARTLDPPTIAEIRDKSKRDIFRLSISICQTVWFVAQCLARVIQDVAITELEIVTLAYIFVSVLAGFFWLGKPRSVNQPVRIQDNGTCSPFIEKRISIFHVGKLERRNLYFTKLIASIATTFFGAIHCIAWSSQYPSHMEQLLWRISSIIVVSIPGISTLIYFPLYKMGKINLTGVDRCLSVMSIVAVPTYLAARVMLLVLAFTSLRLIPQSAYQTISLSFFFPHF